MDVLIFLGLVVIVVFSIARGIIKGLGARKLKIVKEKAIEPKIEISVSTTPSFSSGSNIPDIGPLTPTKDGWILNPKSHFPLTVCGVDFKTANELKQFLDAGFSEGMYTQARKILPIIMRSNFRCKEIDDYINNYKPKYFNQIDIMKKASQEWTFASENDREDLLSTFRDNAIESLDVRPYCDLITLFESKPTNALFDALIDQFGYDNVQLYFSYSEKQGKVLVIPANHHNRNGMEKLVKMDLAKRGNDIALSDILVTLKLKDMNELISDLKQKPFSRKANATEFLLNMPDIKERIGKIVTFRELFQLKLLPNNLSNIGLNKFQAIEALNYATEISNLIVHTYIMGGYSARNINMGRDILSYIKSWKISPVNDDSTCPYCKRVGSKEYAKKEYPRVPLHIGCRCNVLSNME